MNGIKGNLKKKLGDKRRPLLHAVPSDCHSRPPLVGSLFGDESGNLEYQAYLYPQSSQQNRQDK